MLADSGQIFYILFRNLIKTVFDGKRGGIAQHVVYFQDVCQRMADISWAEITEYGVDSFDPRQQSLYTLSDEKIQLMKGGSRAKGDIVNLI